MIGNLTRGAVLACAILAGCASHPRLESHKTRYNSDSDSIRTLIRRGMMDEAQATLDASSGAMPVAEWRKLSAMISEEKSDWLAAADHWRHAADLEPDSTRSILKCWSALLQAVALDSTQRESLRQQVRQSAESFAGDQSLRALNLAYSASAMLGDSTATNLGDQLCQLYPASDEANDLIGSRFWDGMYPIWTNDSAKIPYFHDFITKYSASDWAQYARRNLIASYFALGDTASAVSKANVMVHFNHDNPLVLAHGVAALFDVAGQEDTVKVWAERAYALRDKLTRPSYYSPPEWTLIETATRAGFPLTLAGIHLRRGQTLIGGWASLPVLSGEDSTYWTGRDAHPPELVDEHQALLALARRYAEESHRLAVYDLDDNNTSAPQHYLLGRIALAEGDSTEAAEWWVEAAIDGDVYNRFAGRAIDSLRAMIGLNTENTDGTEVTEKEFISECRKIAHYKGITFDRVTKEVGLDSARGSRVAWGDYDGDGDDDLLAGGSKLFHNNFGSNDSRFYDVTESVQINTVANHGGVWADYNNDGVPDIFDFSSSGNIEKSEKLLQGTSDMLKSKLEASGDSLLLEIFSRIAFHGFVDATPSSPSLPDSFSTEAAIWFDANGDGLLDLYIPGYERPAKGADDLGNAWPSRLMVQSADGTFHDSTEAYGLVPKDGRWFCARSPVACDFDRDGDQDLYVGNYRLQENQFWINGKRKMENGTRQPDTTRGFKQSFGRMRFHGHGFENMAALYEVDGEEHDGWWGHTIGCQWADFDTDGDFDLIACNLAHPRYIGFSNRTMLYRNDLVASTIVDATDRVAFSAVDATGGVAFSAVNATGKKPPFTNVQREWGIKYEECHSEPVFGDFDNDGDLDLFITCVYPNRRSFLYENKGDHFKDVTFLSGARIFNGWGCATSDYDNDGKLDLAACEGGKIELFHNTTESGNNWIEIVPDRSPGVHLSQIGGIVEVIAGGKKYIRQFEGGKGAGSQNSGTLHFGLGKANLCSVRVFNHGKAETCKMSFSQDSGMSLNLDLISANQKFEIGK